MAAQKPTQKAELIAIYRLEFYRKQKNWKLSADTKKEKEQQNSYPTAPVKTSNILNETYSIESNTNNNVNILNDAFLKDDTDKDAPVSSTARTSLSTQWLEPIKACEQCSQHTDQKAQNPWADYVDDNWPGSTDVVDKCSGDGNEGFDDWAEGMVWTNSDIPQVGWTGDAAAPMNFQDSKPPDQMAWPTGTMLCYELNHLDQINTWPDDQMWAPHVWAEDEVLTDTLESIDEFMIGAHNAPHSSEVELCEPEYDDEELKIDDGSLSRMSGAALAAAVRRHSGSLRRLLREAGQRRKYRSTLSLDVCAQDHVAIAPRGIFSTDHNYEAFPTKDNTVTPQSLVYPRNVLFTPPPPTNQCTDGFVPLPLTNQCEDGLVPLPLTKQCENGFVSLPLTNKSKDDLIPLPLINPCTEGTQLVSTIQYKNDVAPKQITKQCKDGFTPLPSTNPFKGAFMQLQPTSQCKDVFTPVSSANLYRDGFLAGSYRNKVALAFVGRGRGRLREDREVKA